MTFSVSGQLPSSAATSSPLPIGGQPGFFHDAPLALFATAAGSSFRLWKNDCHCASTEAGSA
jgi:hypothetical protein